jgi:DNA-binding FadR family transcriptional regulator
MTRFDISPIRQASLTDQTVEALLDQILTRRLEPGTTLPSVADLAARLGVSRPVVREALNALKALGVIEVATGKKATVRGLDGDVLRLYFHRAVQSFDGSVRDLMEVRIGVESRAAALAARHRSEADLTALRATLEQMKAATAAKETFARHDAAMHLEIARASANRLILQIVESLHSALRQASLLGLRAMPAGVIPARIVEEHEALVAAIAAQDAPGAERIMRDHLSAALDRLS